MVSVLDAAVKFWRLCCTFGDSAQNINIIACMADNQVQIEQLQTGDYVAVEVKSKASTLKAIKVLLE